MDDYGRGRRFECLVAPVGSFDDLAGVLAQLLDEPRAFVIRGEPLPGRDLTEILRTKNPRDGEPPGFREVPRRWVMFDCDQALGREAVADLDMLRAEDCVTGIKRLIAQLPVECRQASCFWQLSGSTGFKPGLRAHLWYWLDRPMGERELTRWAENVNDAAGRRLVDPAVFRTVQPCYTANPVFDVGVSDPVALRSGVVRGAPELELPKLAERAGAWLRKLDPLRDPRNDNVRDPVMRACASYFCARGADADAGELAVALRRAIDHSCALRGVTDSKYDSSMIEEHVASGRAFARDKAAAGENLARNQDGTPRSTTANVHAILTSSPEWDGVLGLNLRRGVTLLVPPPFGEDYAGAAREYPTPWLNVDTLRLVKWLAGEGRSMQADKTAAYDAVDLIARSNPYDPVADYLRGLAWDGEPRLDRWLVDLCGVEDSTYARRVGSMWMVAAVARALEPGCKADCILVLEGAQGRRKSTLLRDLAGGLDYFREGIGDIRERDSLMAVANTWITEIREMAGLSNRAQEQIKSFLDRQNDHYRAPYDRVSEDHPRRFALAATTNLEEYLHDPTGARRWWPVRVTACDLERLDEVRDQLWAEAAARYRAGEPWWVEADDPDFVREQEARYDGDPREELLAEALVKGCVWKDGSLPTEMPVPAIPPNTEQVTVTQVLWHHWKLRLSDHKRYDRDIATMLKRLGWTKKKAHGRMVWKRA